MVRLGELPGETTAKPVDITENEMLGLTFASASAVSAGCERGVVVMDISLEGAAADTGLLVGDIILSVGGKAVDTPADVGRIVNDARAHSKLAIMLRLRRGATFAFVAISIS
jgi:serine protease Do